MLKQTQLPNPLLRVAQDGREGHEVEFEDLYLQLLVQQPFILTTTTWKSPTHITRKLIFLLSNFINDFNFCMLQNRIINFFDNYL
jgi:hypothetical protein